MKVLLFLYPIKEYFESCMKIQEFDFNNIDHLTDIRMINAIILRYRKNGYRVFWLVFSVSDMNMSPNVSTIDNRIIKIEEDDFIIHAGMSFKTHTTRLIYPSLIDILNQVKYKIGKVEKLVLGGFHKNDCVKKMAIYAENSGIKTVIEDNLTELFFCKLSLYGISYISTNRIIQGGEF